MSDQQPPDGGSAEGVKPKPGQIWRMEKTGRCRVFRKEKYPMLHGNGRLKDEYVEEFTHTDFVINEIRFPDGKILYSLNGKDTRGGYPVWARRPFHEDLEEAVAGLVYIGEFDNNTPRHSGGAGGDHE